MQKPQPTQYFGSTSTTPSGASKVAPTGHACTHGECSHKLQSFGTKNDFRISSRGTRLGGNPFRPPFGESTIVSPRGSPEPGIGFLMMYRSIQVRKYEAPCGTLFSALHASTHEPQPMQRSMSNAISHLCFVGS